MTDNTTDKIEKQDQKNTMAEIMAMEFGKKAEDFTNCKSLDEDALNAKINLLALDIQGFGQIVEQWQKDMDDGVEVMEGEGNQEREEIVVKSMANVLMAAKGYLGVMSALAAVKRVRTLDEEEGRDGEGTGAA